MSECLPICKCLSNINLLLLAQERCCAFRRQVVLHVQWLGITTSTDAIPEIKSNIGTRVWVTTASLHIKSRISISAHKLECNVYTANSFHDALTRLMCPFPRCRRWTATSGSAPSPDFSSSLYPWESILSCLTLLCWCLFLCTEMSSFIVDSPMLDTPPTPIRLRLHATQLMNN